MRIQPLVVCLALAFGLACGKPPTPEELVEQTSTDVDNFWQEAVATARITNTMQVRDELFLNLEGLQRYPPTSRPVIPDSSSTNDAFADFRVLTKRVFTNANITTSGGSMATFRVTGTDLCTPLRGSFNADSTCVRNVDNLKVAIRAVGGSAGVDLTFLVDDTKEVGTVEIRKGVSAAVIVDLANARAAAEFVNNTLGMDSPFRNLTFDGKGKVDVRLIKRGTSDFEFLVSFLTDLSGTVTDNNGFTRSGSSAAKSPAISVRIEGPAKNVTANIDIGASEFRGMWSDFFDYKLKTPMVWTLSGLNLKAAAKDNGTKSVGFSLGQGANTLSYGTDVVASATLNPNASNKFDVEVTTGSNGLAAFQAKPGVSFALSFNLQPVANAGSMISPQILNATYSYDLTSSDQAPKFELQRPTMMMDATLKLTQGSLALANGGSARTFTSPQCLAFRQNLSSSMNGFVDFFMKCEECVNGSCGGVQMQSPECKKYIGCYEATGGTIGSLDSSYGAQGTCWTTSSAAAESCTSACKSAITSLASAYPNVQACK